MRLQCSGKWPEVPEGVRCPGTSHGCSSRNNWTSCSLGPRDKRVLNRWLERSVDTSMSMCGGPFSSLYDGDPPEGSHIDSESQISVPAVASSELLYLIFVCTSQIRTPGVGCDGRRRSLCRHSGDCTSLPYGRLGDRGYREASENYGTPPGARVCERALSNGGRSLRRWQRLQAATSRTWSLVPSDVSRVDSRPFFRNPSLQSSTRTWLFRA